MCEMHSARLMMQNKTTESVTLLSLGDWKAVIIWLVNRPSKSAAFKIVCAQYIPFTTPADFRPQTTPSHRSTREPQQCVNLLSIGEVTAYLTFRAHTILTKELHTVVIVFPVSVDGLLQIDLLVKRWQQKEVGTAPEPP